MSSTLNWKGPFVHYMLLLVIFTGCAGRYSWQALPVSSEDERTIYVVSLGWNTGLILPYDSLSALPDLEKVMGESTYYGFGWGNADFFQGGRGHQRHQPQGYFVVHRKCSACRLHSGRSPLPFSEQ
ncbi:MAG: hypothetical protein ACJ0DH_08540 [bacterium]